MFSLALEMGRSVDALLEECSASELQQWMAFLAVRQEKEIEARKRAADGDDDDEVIEWGEEPEDDDE